MVLLLQRGRCYILLCNTAMMQSGDFKNHLEVENVTAINNSIFGALALRRFLRFQK